MYRLDGCSRGPNSRCRFTCLPVYATRNYKIAYAAWGPVRARASRVEPERKRAVRQRYGICAAELREIVRRQVMWDAFLDEVIERNVNEVLELAIIRKEFTGTDAERECFALTRASRFVGADGAQLSWVNIQRKFRAPWLRRIGQLRTTNAPVRPSSVPEDAIRQVLRFDKSKQRQHHSDIARAVGVSEATVSRILSGRIQPTDNAELLERYKQVAAAARIEGARRFKIGWVSGPTLRELNRKYLWHRRRRWGR
jgi:hypothetical protein